MYILYMIHVMGGFDQVNTFNFGEEFIEEEELQMGHCKEELFET